MIHNAKSEKPPRMDRYKVSRPRRQRIAGWCSVSSAALLLFLIVLIAGGENRKGLRGVSQWFPVGTFYVLGFLGILFIISLVSAVYWMHVESESDGSPRQQESDEAW